MKLEITISTGKHDTEHGGTITLDSDAPMGDWDVVRISMDPRYGEGICLSLDDVRQLSDSLRLILQTCGHKD